MKSSTTVTLRSSQMDVTRIVMIRGDGAYSWVYLNTGEKIFTSRTVKHWVHFLNSSQLMRVHRSFAIHTGYIDVIEPQSMLIRMDGGLIATIARSKMKTVKQWLRHAS